MVVCVWEVEILAKPSIFSSDYNERMEKRRRRRTFIIILVILIAITAFFYSKGSIKQALVSTKNYIFKLTNKSSKNIKSTDISKNNASKSTNKPSNNKGNITQGEEKSYTVTLSDGKQIKTVYQETDGNKKFETVTSDTENVDYNISPSGTGVVIYDSAAQNLIYVDINGSISDITKKDYVSFSNNQVFNKDEVLKSNPNYVWDTSPKFIDDENIAYISQLPWFTNDAIKYVWIVNVKNVQNQRCFESIKGINIQFDKLTDKGLTINVDSKTVYLDANGNITEN